MKYSILITVTKHFIGFGYLLEFFGRELLFIWIFVWMPFECQSAVPEK